MGGHRLTRSLVPEGPIDLRVPSLQRSFAAAMAIVMTVAALAGAVRADQPSSAADELLRLVPPDATVVVTVEGLRDRAREILGSRLASDFRDLPAVRAWLASDKARELKRSFGEIETSLKVKLADLRDEVLGDAVILAMRMDPSAPADPGKARGMLLLKARDAGLASRLIDAINASQRQSGELARLSDRRRGDTTYHVREFPDGSGRPAEWYICQPDGTFAFSNSEALIQGVIDRKARSRDANAGAGADPGLGGLPRVEAVRRRLPERALARLYIDPRAIERLLAAAPAPTKPAEARMLAMLRRHVASVDYAGAALVWRPEAIVVHAVESLDASRADSWLRHWAGDTRPFPPEMRRVPSTAMAMASARLDLSALREVIYQVVPESDHPRLANFESVLRGVLLGQDLASRILPAIGPGAIAYVESPAEGGDPGTNASRGRLFPLVLVVDLSGGHPAEPRGGDGGGGRAWPSATDAIDNALRTLLALMALDEKRAPGGSAIATTDAAGARVATLRPPIPFAYAVDRASGRLVLGTSAPSVARYLEAAADPEAGARFRDLRAAAFPEYDSFVCIDLDAVTRLGGRYRARVASKVAARRHRPEADVERDLEHVLALANLFRAAFIAGRIEPDATAIHRTFGLILHGPEGDKSRKP